MNERQTKPGAARHLTAKNANNRRGVLCLAPRVLRPLSKESAAKEPQIGKKEAWSRSATSCCRTVALPGLK
jgi:hypothetical protein